MFPQTIVKRESIAMDISYEEVVQRACRCLICDSSYLLTQSFVIDLHLLFRKYFLSWAFLGARKICSTYPRIENQSKKYSSPLGRFLGFTIGESVVIRKSNSIVRPKAFGTANCNSHSYNKYDIRMEREPSHSTKLPLFQHTDLLYLKRKQ